MYIFGPLPTAPGNYTHAVVEVEYFSKWVEAKPLLSITSATIQKIFWQNTVCRFGVPYCRAYSPGTHTRKDENGLLLEFPFNPNRTRSV
jgi:hypothetical protein